MSNRCRHPGTSRRCRFHQKYDRRHTDTPKQAACTRKYTSDYACWPQKRDSPNDAGGFRIVGFIFKQLFRQTTRQYVGICGDQIYVFPVHFRHEVACDGTRAGDGTRRNTRKTITRGTADHDQASVTNANESAPTISIEVHTRLCGFCAC
jgi:hypothetical protein